jgi:ATP-dependent Lhr-like helicase
VVAVPDELDSLPPLACILTPRLDCYAEPGRRNRADRAILLAVKKRLSDSKVFLVCTNCQEWQSRTTVGNAPERPVCQKCDARSVAVLRPWEKELMKTWERSKKAFTDDDRARWRRLQANAGTVMAHGRRGMLCLVARGVGPETAGRILLRQRDDELGLLRDILEAEVNYARTRQFWD